MLRWRQVHHALGTRGRRHDAHATWPLQQDIAQFATPFYDIGQGPLGRQPEQDINVRQPQVGVQ
ncbi:hypothetical protein D9M73_190800 [compost metagenome]